MTAWLNKVPYHGTWPRASRESVVPMKPTIAAAVGPPRAIAARIGATLTDATVPRGRRTGSALATSVRTVQNARPRSRESSPPAIVDRGGKTRAAAANTRIATATVDATSRLTVEDTSSSPSGERAGVYHLGYQPLREAPPASARVISTPRDISRAESL